MSKITQFMDDHNVQTWHVIVLGIAVVVLFVMAAGALSGVVTERSQVVEYVPDPYLQNLDPNSEQYKMLSEK